MSNKVTCPICGEGHLTRHFVTEKIAYKGRSQNYDHVYSVCDLCQVEQVGAEDMKLNKRAVIRAKKQMDGLLSGREIVAIREKLGINQDKAAKIFGGGPNAFSKYENDDVAQSEAMDKLIRIAAEFPSVFNKLCHDAGVTSKSSISWSTLHEMTSFEEFIVSTKEIVISQH